MPNSARHLALMNFYSAMIERLGPSHWWPGESPFEVVVGAILTQNTNWANVEKAIWNLKLNDLLTPEKLHALPMNELADLIRPAGYFRIKAQRLKHFLSFLRTECRFRLEDLQKMELTRLREKLLEIKGIGPETADSILLYALGRPSFVVDGYTRRILNRHMLVPDDIPYDELRDFFMDVLPVEPELYNEYHALLVRVGKTWCRKSNPLCPQCPLHPFLRNGTAQ